MPLDALVSPHTVAATLNYLKRGAGERFPPEGADITLPPFCRALQTLGNLIGAPKIQIRGRFPAE